MSNQDTSCTDIQLLIIMIAIGRVLCATGQIETRKQRPIDEMVTANGNWRFLAYSLLE